MDDLALRLVGQRYEALDGIVLHSQTGLLSGPAGQSREAEVIEWLRSNM